jgi:hypothetical protein
MLANRRATHETAVSVPSQLGTTACLCRDRFGRYLCLACEVLAVTGLADAYVLLCQEFY